MLTISFLILLTHCLALRERNYSERLLCLNEMKILLDTELDITFIQDSKLSSNLGLISTYYMYLYSIFNIYS